MFYQFRDVPALPTSPHVGDCGTQERRGIRLLGLFGIFTAFDLAFEIFSLLLCNGSLRSSCASVHSNSEVRASDNVARKVKGSPGKQIGVMVCGPSREVTRTYNKPSMRVERSKAKANVQMYVNGDKNRPASSLSSRVELIRAFGYCGSSQVRGEAAYR